MLLLLKAHELHPTAKRVLLVGRRDWTPENPAVRAMTLGQIDTYLFEPWLPVGRFLDLPISQVLADWVPSRGPSFEGIRIVGPRWGTRSHELRDVLTRMGIPHGWYQADSAEGRRLLEEAGEDGERLPVVVFHSGQVFVDPSDAELVAALGFGTRPAAGTYDLVIVGPAGLAAAVYAASEGLDTLVVEPRAAGGQAGTSSMIRNYLGFPRGIGGGDLANRALEQAWLFGANLVLAQRATGLRVDGPGAWSGCRTAPRSPPRRWWWPPGWPGAGSGCRSWRRWSGRGCSTARPGPRPGPWRPRTCSWSGPATPPPRPRCTWPSTPPR